MLDVNFMVKLTMRRHVLTSSLENTSKKSWYTSGRLWQIALPPW